jgi:tetratricopeptide (TPR) repeat protein
MYEGLKFIFDGYEPSPEDVARSLKFPAYVNVHFREFSTKMGTRFLPSEERIDQYAAKLAPEEALEWYRLNADNYPDSAHAQFALGKAYAARGEKQLAVRALERSLERNPGQPEAEEILRKCRQ